jgi:hypothetical protein
MTKERTSVCIYKTSVTDVSSGCRSFCILYVKQMFLNRNLENGR